MNIIAFILPLLSTLPLLLILLLSSPVPCLSPYSLPPIDFSYHSSLSHHPHPRVHPSSSSSSSSHSHWKFTADGPLQIRTSFSPTGLTVGWTTFPPYPIKSLIHYGVSEDQMNSIAYSVSSNYGTNATFHYAQMPNLLSNTLYYYQITLLYPTMNTSSSIYPVLSSRLPTDNDGQFTTLVVGDLGIPNPVNSGANNTISSMYFTLPQYDWILHVGDASYADDYWWASNGTKMTYEEIWNSWQSLMTPIASRKPYMLCVGNHEVTCNELTPSVCTKESMNFTSYLHRFQFNGESYGGEGNMWYSFPYSLVTFIQLNTETDYPDSKSGPGTSLNANNFGRNLSSQIDWLRNELILANKYRDIRPWIVVSSHRPIYSTADHDQCLSCRDAFQSLANEYSVDLWLSGHSHFYERFYPSGLNYSMPNGQSYDNPTVPVYILNGAGGSIEGITPNKYIGNRPNNSAVFLKDFGYGMLRIRGESILEWEYYGSQNGTLLDKMTLIKDRKGKGK